MNLSAAEQIAKAILYEGYMLYPYRRSAVKNQQRWTFGVLYPQSYSEAQEGADPCVSQTQCLVRGSVFPAIEIKVRFLQIIDRTVGQLVHPILQWSKENTPEFNVLPSLSAGGRVFQPWEEAGEQEISLEVGGDASVSPTRHECSFSAERHLEPIEADGQIVGVVIRDTKNLSAAVDVGLEHCGEDIFKFTVRICNTTSFDSPTEKTREQALASSLISVHTVLGGKNCEFVSLLEPPGDLQQLASNCQNTGTWPVLIGKAGSHDTMLSSPIILYDYPQIAPESAGDLFDGTEIDEILSLRIMTLTDAEKREMRDSDDRARQILERTETLPPEQLMKLHGVLRNLRPLDKEAS
ncbi:MAG TPA: hypothetical protein VGQ12_01105 [Candidatus Angelobacter sp.]|jgi:hydrogenase maturation protease|nr:hypothetical protein [Candidatus Angelobacter sp.]